MPLHCLCPSCGRKLHVPEGLSGRTVKCPSCQSTFKLVAKATEAAPILDVEAVSDPDEGTPSLRTEEEERLVAASARLRPRGGQTRYADETVEDIPALEGPPQGKAIVTMALLGVAMVLDFLAIVIEFFDYQRLDGLEKAHEVPNDELDFLDIIGALTGFAQSGIFILTAIFFCMWFYRAYKNLKEWGIKGLSYSPGWAVGSFFVPILNLFRPYQIAQEIWKASDPRVSLSSGKLWRHGQSSSAIVAWWAFFLISNIANNIALRAQLSASRAEIGGQISFGQLKIVTIAWLISDALSFVAAGLAIILIKNIQSRQLQKYLNLSAEEPVEQEMID